MKNCPVSPLSALTPLARGMLSLPLLNWALAAIHFPIHLYDLCCRGTKSQFMASLELRHSMQALLVLVTLLLSLFITISIAAHVARTGH